MRKALFVRRPVVQVALIILLLAVVAVVFTRAQEDYAWANLDRVTYSTLRASDGVTETYSTLRVYGGPGWPKLPGNMGAGSGIATDEKTGLLAEAQPYTDPLSVFNPQLPQAPRKDSITWNPIWMSPQETEDENWANPIPLGLYGKIRATGSDASEKVWFRMWYEPEHWDKDLNASGDLDRYDDGQPVAPMNPTSTSVDEWYPAIMQEFTYMLMENRPIADKPEPMMGRAGTVSFVFPVGMRATDLFTDTGVVDTTSENALYGYGLTSLDANFDGIPDIVHVESEVTLFNETDIAADFDGDGEIDPLDRSPGTPLSGDELAVFRLDYMTVPLTPTSESYVQFLDHLVRLDSVYHYGAMVEIYYTGDLVPKSLGSLLLREGDMALAGSSGPPQLIEAVSNGGPGTNMCIFPTGPFFVYLQTVDPDDPVQKTATLMLGRALGATHSGMEDSPGSPDRRPGDPWFLKRFYVDGHEYNVVAIKTDGFDLAYIHDCDLDDGYQEGPPSGLVGIAGDGIIDVTQGEDTTDFKFITIRTPIPKVPVLIEQHSVNLQDYALEDWLSVMPPYNYEHYIIEDVQAITAFDKYEAEVDYLGKLVGPVPPILQKNGPFPYMGVGPYSPYDDKREMYLAYVKEDKNPQFLGELKEKYGEITATTVITEFWCVEQWWTRPWEYTEFVLPDIRDAITEASSVWDPNGAEPDPDLYLLTSAFTAPQAEYLYWIQDVADPLRYNLFWEDLKWNHIATNTITSEPKLTGWKRRVKLWFDPAVADKTYKNEEGLRIFGMDLPVATGPFDDFYTGPGNTTVTDPVDPDFPVEIPPYTDPWAPFNPQLPEAPRKDSLTFNPAYMNEFYQPHDDLYDLYRQIAIEEHDAREKVFPRMWYEPVYLDKVRFGEVYTPTNWITVTQVYTFPAVMQEFTYMFLNTQDEPSHGQPRTSRLAFPIGTTADELPAPVGGAIPPGKLPSFGYGLTTFDADFDGSHDIVTIHSEETISETLGIGVDFDGNGSIDQLDIDGVELSGDELVIFTVENIVLGLGESAMFLDHMITLDNVSASGAVFDIWYTGGGLHTPSSLHPDHKGMASLGLKDMALVYKGVVDQLSQGANNLGWPSGWPTAGPWFVYLKTTNTTQETAVVTIGRALGATHSAMDNGGGGHDVERGDPWWLKRFFVDGHEYNVVAIKTVPADVVNPGDEYYEFKYITIRTPVPKVNFVNDQDSQKLEGYNLVTVPDVFTSTISVMPPFNFHHTRVEDIQRLEEGEFARDYDYDSDCMGVVEGPVDPLQIQIVDEDKDEQFFGELKEKYWEDGGEKWSTEQFHTLPDRYTDLELLAGQLYLLTSDWRSDESWVHYYGCNPAGGYFTQTVLSGLHPDIPGPNAVITFTDGITNTYYIASVTDTLRVKFWYDPEDSDDIYKNTWGCTVKANAGEDQAKCAADGVTPFTLSGSCSGGTPPYTCRWYSSDPCVVIKDSNSCITDVDITCPVSHSITLECTDDKDCKDTDNVVLTVVTITATAGSNSVCLGGTIELSATVSGGVPPYTYTWKGPDSWTITNTQNPTRPNATLAMSGTYTLIVTDSLGCSDSDMTDVVVDVLTVTASSNSPVCLGETIELSATVSGGIPPYTYTWRGPDGWTITNTQNPTRPNATLAMSGTYTLIVTDSLGCSDSDMTDVVVDVLTATATSNSPVCLGGTIELSATVSGGIPPYTCTWKGPDGCIITNTQNPTRPNATLAMSGTYTLIVTDSLGCSDFDTTDVIVEVITATADSNSPVCLGGTIELSATVSGGVPPYTYTWKGPDSWTITNTQNPTRPNATLAMSGTYTLIVTDSLGCSDFDTTDVIVDVITVTADSNSPVCLGGTIELSATVSGGIPPYTYTWKGPDGWTITNTQNPTRPNATLAMSGTYTLIVTDSLGCSDFDTTDVVVGPEAEAGYPQIKCKADGVTTFTLSGSASGGTEPYTYEWSSDDPCVDIKSPNSCDTEVGITCIGSYPITLTVTDDKECQDTDQVVLTVVTITATASSNSPVCEGETLCLYGGPDGMNSYYWKGPDYWESYEQNPCRENAKPSMSGTYTLTITKRFCANTATTMDNYSCTGPGQCSSAERNSTSPNATTAMAGDYSLTVTAIYKLYLPLVAKNYPPCVVCTDTVTTTVTVNPNPTADAGPDKEICKGGSTEIGGDPTCSYGTLPCTSCTCRWSPTHGLDDPTKCNPIASPSSTTTYCVTCTDSKGCTGTDCMTVTVNPNPTATACSNSPVCEGGTIKLWGSASGGTGPYTYHWVGPDGWESYDQNPTRGNATLAMAGTYTLTVTDSKDCKGTATTKVDVVPCVCEELICQGDFEIQPCDCWIIRNTPRPAYYSTAKFHSPSWSMHLGITYQSDAASYSSVYQAVTIPGGAASATLSFWYYPICQDTVEYDWQEAIIFDPTLTHVLAWAMPRVCSNSQTWTHHTFDLTSYKGQTIILYFNVYNDGIGNRKTAMYLDDVSVKACYLP